MNEIIVTTNRVYYESDIVDTEYIEESSLKSFRDHTAKVCRGSLIFNFVGNKYTFTIQYEVIESDPPMEPEQLYKIWRILYE